MTNKAAQVLADGLQLPEDERGDVAARLIESLETNGDEDIQAAWSAEIQKRIEELRQGKVKPLSWPEARRMILDGTGESPPA
jgi:putative addiction module component (TIGR02574 family)